VLRNFSCGGIDTFKSDIWCQKPSLIYHHYILAKSFLCPVLAREAPWIHERRCRNLGGGFRRLMQGVLAMVVGERSAKELQILVWRNRYI